ncbi:MAG: hypothetical protein IJH37_07500 [Clostridia bacterium]|nr:hypothetical protein [Clostridia bacterium]
MKNIMTKAVILSVMISLISTVTALADAWVPPDDKYNDALMSCPYEDEACRGLNTFLSNYAEANVYYYGSDSPDSVVIAGVLKHIELNGKAEETFVSDTGTKYMAVNASVFEEACNRYFGRSISASSCPGYSNGRIVVSASNYKAPIKIFASSVYCRYDGNYQYLVSFEVFQCNGNAQDYYGIARNNLPPSVTKVGEGECEMAFSGTQTTFKSSDFKLKTIKLTNNSPQATDENTPYVVQYQEQNKVQYQASENSRTEEENSQTEEVITPSVAPEAGNSTVKTTAGGSDSSLTTALLISVITAISLSALAAAIILLLFKKKR